MKIPEIIRNGNKATLFSDGVPFMVLGGEVHNSSASNLEYMKESVWPWIRELHLNTLLVPVTWETIEPEQGRFDFSLPDGLIRQAEEEGKKLVFLWFGLWKNGMSTYVPAWMKEDRETYFVMRDRNGKPINAVSPFCHAAVEQDALAFSGLMEHLKNFDVKRTVLMVQVENEMGLLGECRDFGRDAEAVYMSKIPEEIESLYQAVGTWEEAFAEDAPEIFMTCYYAKATEHIAMAGRKKYPIPIYVNAWLEQYPWIPGTYPVGGPIAKHMDLWKALAPSVAFLSPDIYLPDFEAVCEEYTGMGNPLFIPEARPSMDSASNVFAAFGKFGAVGFSPFAVEDLQKNYPPPDAELLKQLNIMEEAFNHYRAGEYLSQSYRLLRGMAGIIEQNRCSTHMIGFTRNGKQQGVLAKFGKYDFQVEYLPEGKDSPKSGGLVIELSEDEFLLCGINFCAVPLPKNHDRGDTEIISIEEGRFENDIWIPERRMNGDEFSLRFGGMPCALRCLLHKYEP